MNKLIPALQPIINTKTGDTTGYEVLVRWHHEGRIILPHEIDPCWVCTDLEMLDVLLDHSDAMARMSQRLFVNVSQDVLQSDSAYKQWRTKMLDLLWTVTYPITVEVLESVSDAVLFKRWQDLRSLGVALAIDDDGEDYSQIERLKKYQWDYCKFDARTLTQDTCIKATRYCAGKSILMIAERVENNDLKQIASQCGLDHHQGFHYYQPEIITEFFEVKVAEC